MNTLQKQLYGFITAVLVFTAGASVAHAADGLINVDFHGNTPLFAESNILPGDGITRPVTVENISDETQAVYIQLLDAVQEKGLADALELRVEDESSGTTLLGPVTLTDLFGGVQTAVAGGLASGEMVTYEVTIAFSEDSGNEYQDGKAAFDFCIGFSGGDIGCDGDGSNPADPVNYETEGGGALANPSNTKQDSDDGNENNGVGGSQENLIITDESAENVDDDDGTADLTWETNKPATSKVVCGPLATAPYNLTLKDNNFGYPWGSDETDTEVTDHIISLIGLNPGTYLCRAASREEGEDDWTVSDEFAFTIASSESAAGPASFIGTGGTPVAFAAEDEESEPEGATDDSFDETERNSQVAGAFASLGDTVIDGTCSTQWWAWIVVLISFLIATIWSREMLTYLTYNQQVKRLYVLGVGGLVVLAVVFMQDATSWILPIGIGTIAILLATILDTVRSSEGMTAFLRLKNITLTILGVSIVTLILAFIFEWLCSILPVVVIAIVLAIRYVLLRDES